MTVDGIPKIFNQAQLSAAHHLKLVRRLMALYEKEDLNHFERTFIICMKYALTHSERSMAVRVLDFVAKFCGTVERETVGRKSNENSVHGYETDGEDDPMSPFVHAVFDELLKNSDNKNQTTRMRVCYTVKKILQELGTEASIDADVCDKISAHMTDRVKDKSPSVRVQAVAALERIQDPCDPDCLVTKLLLFLLNMDQSAEVRRAVLVCLGRTKYTLPGICGRIHDIRDIVRKQAYLSLSKVSMKTHTIQQREIILSQGLRDRSDMVRETVEKILLPGWLENCHRSFMEFLHALDLEHSSELPDKALKVLFKNMKTSDLVRELQLDSGKLIPSDKLTVELVFYWRCLAEYLEKSDELELVVPELTIFCEYIKSNMGMLKTQEVMNPWDHAKEDFIMVQLLELTRVFDYADEAGRENLKKLLLHMLTSPDVRFKLIPVIIKVLDEVVPDVDTRIKLLTEVVSDIHEPLVVATPVEMSVEEKRQRDFKIAQLRVRKNILEDDLEVAVKKEEYLLAQKIKTDIAQLKEDIEELSSQAVGSPGPSATLESKESECADPRIIAKCLQIIYDMVQSPSVTSLTPELRSIKESFILRNMQIDHAVVQVLALQCMGAFGCIDRESAREAMFFFCFHMGTNSVPEVVLTALKGVLDFLFMYGLQTLQIDEIYEPPSEKKCPRKQLMRLSTVLSVGGYSDEDDNDESKRTDDELDFSEDEKDALGGKKQEYLFAMITGLLDKEQGATLHCVVEGLCKLLLAVRIKSPNLVSRLTLLWFNPVYDDDTYLRQILGQFFKMYATGCPAGQEVLEQSFLPSISTVLNAPPSSPLAHVNVETVARFLLDLTKCGVNRYSVGVNVHNSLAIQVCNEIIKETFEGYTAELIQIVCLMDLSLDESQKENLLQMMSKISPLCPDKSSLRALAKLENIIKTSGEVAESTTSGSTTRGKRTSSRAMSEDDSSVLENSTLDRSKAQRTDSRRTAPSVSSAITTIPESEEEDENDSVFGDDDD